MKKGEVKEHIVADGKKLECMICGHTHFWTRKTLMNTTTMTFLNIDWANKSAINYICDKCGYVYWFMPN